MKFERSDYLTAVHLQVITPCKGTAIVTNINTDKGGNEVFVTASSDIRGMNATQIAKRLTIPESETGFKVIEFKTTQGIATPINRDLPGFVGYGRTAGNAREFVIPNQPIPKDAKIKIIP